MMQLNLGENWRLASPRTLDARIAWRTDGCLSIGDTTGNVLHRTAFPGLAECPMSADREGRFLYGYSCNTRLGRQDYSLVLRVDTRTGKSSVFAELGLNQWMNWMLRTWPEKPLLTGLLVTDVPADIVHIRHQLAIWNTLTGRRKLVPLPADSLSPLAFTPQRKKLLFAGMSGIHIVGMDGRRSVTLPYGVNMPGGRGGAFHPEKPLAAIGGHGLWIHDETDARTELVAPAGSYPVWDAGNNGVWFHANGGELRHYDHDRGTHHLVAATTPNDYADISHARSPQVSRCGRHVATILTRASLPSALPRNTGTGNDEAGRRAVIQPADLQHDKALLILDTKKRELWTLPIAANQFCWIG